MWHRYRRFTQSSWRILHFCSVCVENGSSRWLPIRHRKMMPFSPGSNLWTAETSRSTEAVRLQLSVWLWVQSLSDGTSVRGFDVSCRSKNSLYMAKTGSWPISKVWTHILAPLYSTLNARTTEEGACQWSWVINRNSSEVLFKVQPQKDERGLHDDVIYCK